MAQAEAVYRQSFAEIFKVEAKGGLPNGAKPPTALTPLMTGQALESAMQEFYDVHKMALKTVKGNFVITRIAPLANVQHDGSQLALQSCEDGSSLRNKDTQGRIWPGQMAYVVTTYKVIDGKVVMNYRDDSKSVKTCPIA